MFITIEVPEGNEEIIVTYTNRTVRLDNVPHKHDTVFSGVGMDGKPLDVQSAQRLNHACGVLLAHFDIN